MTVDQERVQGRNAWTVGSVIFSRIAYGGYRFDIGPHQIEDAPMPTTARPIFVYGLFECESGNLRYIGSTDTPGRRFYAHCTRSKWLRPWLDSLLKCVLAKNPLLKGGDTAGFKMLLLEEDDGARRRECAWIDTVSRRSSLLLNVAGNVRTRLCA